MRNLISLRHAQDLLHYDFCPWANYWVYWMRHPLACLGAAAVVAVCCGMYVNPVAYAVLVGILLVGGLGAIWPWIAVQGLSGEAEFVTARCRPGQVTTVRLRFRNHAPWPVWGLSIRHGFHDASAIADESSGIALARLNGWAETEFEWHFQPGRRGVYPIEPPRGDTGFPFGLLHASIPIAMRNELVVWPASVPLDAMPDAVEIQTREDQLTDRRAGHCGDMIGTRPFREGDSLRRVHWLQTARQGRMIVVERQSPATCAVRQVIDVFASSHQSTGSSHSIELALEIGASVLESLHRQHAFVELVIADQKFAVGESRAQLWQALDALARVPAAGIDAGNQCHFDRPSRQLPTIAITTDYALTHHRGHGHVSFGERYIVVRTAEGAATLPVRPGCDCSAWIEIDSADSWRDALPQRWRRACRVA
ncbi:MAG: DUF58 domain-containing protein [Planctomycetaceae bacterium]|nr:DUF58 domain-containing protein [Planctomycetaceae bacterium]